MAETSTMRSSTEQAIARLPHLNDLLPLLHRLDQYLARAIAAVELDWGAGAPSDLYGKLHLNLQEVAQLSIAPPGAIAFPVPAENLHEPLPDFVPEGSRLARLQQTFNLSAFDLDIVAIAIAPEIDSRYERLYAELQPSGGNLPSVDLALKLLCPSAAAKLSQRDRFSPKAPLIRHNLLHLVSDASQPNTPLPARVLLLDEQIARFLLGEGGLDFRLTPFCQLVQPAVAIADLLLNESVKTALRAIAFQTRQTQQPLRLYFQGSDRPFLRRAAEAFAAELRVPLLCADLAQIVAAKSDFELILKLILRQAWFENAGLYFHSADILQKEEFSILYQDLLGAVAQHKGIAILAGSMAWKPGADSALGVVTVPFSAPDFALRRQQWQACLNAAGISLSETDLDALSDRFRLSASQIADAVATAWNTARWQAASGEMRSPDIPLLFAAARAESGSELASLARKIEPKYQWEDIVLPADPQAQLREICNQAKYRHVVYEQWGFDRKLSLGKGQNVLFSGPPGTGKTMAAEVIASELRLDLYKIDLSQVVSKYIGETEKNLDRIFSAAASSNAILFFDEADSLFGKRTEVKEARDRYANIEVGYLLQKMEEYEGIAILTTNVRSNIDDAFVRRLRFIVEFPFPTEKQRRQIWEKIWPDATPRSPDLDLDFLARRFEIAGANIRNIALAAAFLAAESGGAVSMSHLIRAVRREYQKMGKILMEEEFSHFAALM